MHLYRCQQPHLVHEIDCLREETVSVSGRSGDQSSVASTRRQQFKEGVCWMWGVQRDFASLFAHSGWVQSLETGEGCTNGLLSNPDYPLKSSEVRFGSWAEPDSYWCSEDGLNDGRVERFQQLLWQVGLPQLAKEVQPLLGLFNHGLNVIIPLQVLRNCGAQEPEWLHCSHSAVYDGGGEQGGFSWSPWSSPHFWAC